MLYFNKYTDLVAMRLESAKENLKIAEVQYRQFGGYDDCGSSYLENLIERKTEVRTLTSILEAFKDISF